MTKRPQSLEIGGEGQKKMRNSRKLWKTCILTKRKKYEFPVISRLEGHNGFPQADVEKLPLKKNKKQGHQPESLELKAFYSVWKIFHEQKRNARRRG
jgi:hypothetical protein